MQIFEELLSRLARNGVFSLQVPYYTHRTPLRSAISKLRRYVPLANSAANLVEGNPSAYPHMEMNIYPLNTLCKCIQAQGVHRLSVNFESDSLYLSATLMGQKS